MANALEWRSRSSYALTEFVVFALGALVFVSMVVFIGLLFCYFRNSKYLSIVKAAHRFMIKTLFSSADDLVQILYPAEKQGKPLQAHSTWGKIVVYIYFTLLSGLVAFWYLAVLSDSLFYRKTGTCNDLSVNDTDFSCFLVSDRNAPPGVQAIIDEEAGELVPCQRVRDYLRTVPNVTYDLEVICYAAQLNPLLAIGVAYGASKSISFVLQIIFKGFMFLATRGRIVKRLLLICQISFVSSVVTFVLIVPPALHDVSGPRNSAFDFLRGDRFFSYAIISLLGISTVLVAGMTPWWAFVRVDLRELCCCCCGGREIETSTSETEVIEPPQESYKKVVEEGGEIEEELKTFVE